MRLGAVVSPSSSKINSPRAGGLIHRSQSPAKSRPTQKWQKSADAHKTLMNIEQNHRILLIHIANAQNTA